MEVGEEEFEEYVGNPVNSLALVKRLSIELDKAGQLLFDHQNHKNQAEINDTRSSFLGSGVIEGFG